jgi:alkylresorcinol/alkylpyrone synthase
MGWRINNQGLQVLFSRDIPAVVRKWVLPNLIDFLSSQGMELKQLRHIIAHPGGAKVIEAYEEALELRKGQMDFARDVLRRHGNMSSPTVLFVLKEFLRSGAIKEGEHAVLTALGPGFSSEMVLIRG